MSRTGQDFNDWLHYWWHDASPKERRIYEEKRRLHELEPNVSPRVKAAVSWLSRRL